VVRSLSTRTRRTTATAFSAPSAACRSRSVTWWAICPDEL